VLHAIGLLVALGVAALIAVTASRAGGPPVPVNPEPVPSYFTHPSTTQPVAGQIFTAAIAVRVVNQDQRPWTLVCHVQLHGFSISPHVQKFGLPRQRYDARSCSFIVPSRATGRLLHLTYVVMEESHGGCSGCGGGAKSWKIARRR